MLMKRLLAVMAFCVLTFTGAQNLFAGSFGIVGGAGFTGMKDISGGLATGYHAGVSPAAGFCLAAFSSVSDEEFRNRGRVCR